jgi:hypothetical protein
MAVRQDKVQISVEIDGKKVQNTIQDLQKSYRQLNNEIKTLTPGSEAFNKKAQELGKIKGYLDDAKNAAAAFGKEQSKVGDVIGKQQSKLQGFLSNIGGKLQGLGGQAGGVGSILSGIGSGAALMATGIGAAIAAVGKGIAEVISITKEFSKLRTEVNSLTGITGPALSELTGQIKGVADTFDQDFTEVLKAANTVSKTFGISIEDAISQISDGFVNGANASGEYLDILKEYPTQLQSVGLGFEEANALILKQTQEGIFSDKGIDAIKEAGIRLRELTPVTRDALDGIGIASDEIEQGLREGSVSLFDVIQQVGGRLGDLEANSPEVGAALADIFGGAGEDAGLEYIKTLGEVTGGIEEVSKASIEQRNRLRDELQATQELNIAKAELAARFEKLVTAGGNFITKVQTFLIRSFNQVVDVLAPVGEAFSQLFALFQSGEEQTDELGKKTTLLDAILGALVLPLRVLVNIWTQVIGAVTAVIGWFQEFYNESAILKSVIQSIAAPISFIIEILGNLSAAFAAINAVINAVGSNVKAFINETILDLRIAAKEVQNFFSFSVQTKKELAALKEQKAEFANAYTELGKAAGDAYNQALADESAKSVEIIQAQAAKTANTEQAKAQAEAIRLRKEAEAKAKEEAKRAQKEAEAQAKSAADARVKQEAELAKRIEEIQISLIQDSLERKLAEIDLASDRELAALQGTEEQITQATILLNQKRSQAIMAAMEADLDQQQKIRDDDAKRELTQEQRDQDRALAHLDQYNQERITEITLAALEEAQAGAFESKEEAEKAIQDRLIAQLKDYLQQRIDLLTSFGEDVSALEAELANLKIDELLAPSEGDGGGEGLPEWYDKLVSGLDAARAVLAEFWNYQKQEAQEAYDAETSALEAAKKKELQVAGNNAKAREAIELKYQQKRDAIDKEFKQKEKQRAITQSIIDTAIAVVKAIGTPPAPNIAAGVLTGIIGAAQTGIIASKTFATGGFTGPGEGQPDETGYKVSGYVHQDEYVSPKWQVKSPVYRPLIDALEVGRLRGYAGGGPVSPVTPGDSVVRSAGSRQTLDVLREEISGLRGDLGKIQFVMPIDEPMADLVGRRQSELSSRRSNNAL